MFSTTDTIVAIATPPGRGGIGVVRVSGPEAYAITHALLAHPEPLAARHATLVTIQVHAPHAAAWEPIDQAIATYFPAPHSYTGDDVVELSTHGSPIILKMIVGAAIREGARLAMPGEFTLRAYLNGRIDLPQAEAVADLVDAVTPLQARVAFDQLQGTLTTTIATIDQALFDLTARLEASIDFPDEGYHFIEPAALADALGDISERLAALLADARRGRLVREGLQVAIIGRPNVGKSSLFNALVGADRAIVTDVPGTTRDLITEVVDLCGMRVTLVDTAGLRQSDDPVEAEGVARSHGASRSADIALILVDRSKPWPEDDESMQDTDNKRLIVASKSDLHAAWTRPDAIEVSSVTGAGLDDLQARIVQALGIEQTADRPEITNVRHAALVERAHEAVARARTAVLAGDGQLSEEFVLVDLQDARGALEEITGKRTPDDVLAHVFAKFCVGK